jgi:hypothetical protein
MTKKILLEIELVPKSSWYNNVRAVVTKAQWDKLKSAVYAQAYYVCEICGGEGPKHPVECHEVWIYDDKEYVQRLERMIALCPSCHQVKHFGLAEVQGKRDKALKHFMKINQLTKSEAEKHIENAFKKWDERSKKPWLVDLSNLKDYGINHELIDIAKLKKAK